jgi:hypothetical protein
VLGDIGIVGACVYIGLYGSVVVALWRRKTPMATAALEGWAMLAVLGLVFDWWEQPPILVFLAVLSGLALTGGSQQHTAETTAPRQRRRLSPVGRSRSLR